MTFFTSLRFTKQLSVGNKICSNSPLPCCSQGNSPLQQQLKEAIVGAKTLKAQQYLELKRIYTESNPQNNELLLLDAFRKVLA